MIRKLPLYEAQTASGKQKKYIMWNVGVCFIAKINYVENCFPVQNFY